MARRDRIGSEILPNKSGNQRGKCDVCVSTARDAKDTCFLQLAGPDEFLRTTALIETVGVM